MGHRFVLFAAVSLFFSGYTSALAASLNITSNSTSLSPGDVATLYVVLNSEGVAINNAEATIKFPTDLFDIVSVSKAGSVFSLWVEEPSFSNSSGVVTFNGGVPTPGFNGSQGPVLSIAIRAKSSGQGDFVFSSAAVRANDGLGSDVLNNKQGKSITVVKKDQPAPAVSPAPVAESLGDIALHITSPTHANQDQWYKDQNPVFQWVVPAGVDAVQTAIDRNTSGTPRVTYSPPVKEKAMKDLKDGVWYFKARAREDGKWGSTSTFIARIDTTVPKKNDVSFSYDDDKKILSINADIVDETSGLDYYEVYINDILVKKIPSGEFAQKTYNLPFDTPGDNTVKLVAVDRAGNSVESLGTFQTTVLAVAQPEPVPAAPISAEEGLFLTVGTFSVPVWYAGVGSLLIIILATLIAFYFGRHYNKLQHKIKVRSALANRDNTKVLVLLKKRLEKHLEILQNTRHNRILSKEEKEIKEAIEGDLDEVDRALEEQKAG